LLLLALAFVPSGCGDDSAPPMITCPNDLPPACVLPSPSYATDVEPIVARRCFPCHNTGGVALPARDFSTYDKIKAQADTGIVLTQVYACKMPPPDAAPPTADERATLLHWLVCNAPP